MEEISRIFRLGLEQAASEDGATAGQVPTLGANGHMEFGGGTQSATVSLTSAEILDLHNTPVTLIDAPGEGKMLVPFCAVWGGKLVSVRHSGGVNPAYSIGPDFEADALGFLTAVTMPDGNADEWGFDLIMGGSGAVPGDPTATIADQPLTVALGAGVSGGDSTVSGVIYYAVFVLP